MRSSFFVQAEDGIRDLTVTGVQTCALPIWPRGKGPARAPEEVPPLTQAQIRIPVGLEPGPGLEPDRISVDSADGVGHGGASCLMPARLGSPRPGSAAATGLASGGTSTYRSNAPR